jgi:predicted SprT family Zn-dependent metalloprotease
MHRQRALERKIRRYYGRNIKLHINNNTTNVFLLEKTYSPHQVKLSLHRIFLKAPAPVIKALVRFIKNPVEKYKKDIRIFIYKHSDEIESEPRNARSLPLVTKGKHFNLAMIMRRMNRDYFRNRLRVKITWGKAGIVMGKARSNIQFANFDANKNLIRINPALDKRIVPKYFMDYIVFHEMLHKRVPPTITLSGRLYFHTKAFRQREREFKDFKKAVCWQRKNWDRL